MATTTASSEAIQAFVGRYTREDLDQALAERALWEYTQQAWPMVEPEPFVPGWHIQAVCEHLQAQTAGQIRDLIINIPPRHTKSLTTSVMWPSWEWGPGGRAKTRWLFTSYATGLTLRDSVKCRRVIQSQWYQQRWGNRYYLLGDQNAKERYDNNRGGVRIASSVGGLGTGEGGDRIVVDDPHNIKDIELRELGRQEVADWWDQVMYTRRNNLRSGSRTIIMQRSHHQDLSGHIEVKERDGWVWLVLPARYEPKRHCVTCLGFADPRKEDGEPLWPERQGVKELDAAERSMGSYVFAGQFQQRPAPMEGGILKRHWWGFFQEWPRPQWFDLICQSWDLAFKDLKSSAYVCGQVWGLKGANRYLLDETHDKLDFVKTLNAIQALTERWPQAHAKLIEDAANGPAVMSTLRDKVEGLLAISPSGSKESRAIAVSPLVEAGNVYLPHPSLCPWIDRWIQDQADFPNGEYKDRTDAFTQAMLWLSQRVRRTGNLAPVVDMTRNSPWVWQQP